jgi:hypothetical protein
MARLTLTSFCRIQVRIFSMSRTRQKEPASIPDEETVPFELLTVRSIPVSYRSPEERKKDIDDILIWRRHGKPETDDTDTTDEFKKIDCTSYFQRRRPNCLKKEPGRLRQ